MHRYLLSGLILSWLGGSPLAQSTPKVDGFWQAVYADNLESGRISLNLVELEQGKVVGTYTSDSGVGGKLIGRLEGNTLKFELRAASKDCRVVYSGSIVFRGGKAAGTYTGTSCLGDHGTGTFTMIRSGTPASGRAEDRQAPRPVITYGSPEEIRNVRTVYVYTAPDAESLKARRNIIKNLRKYDGFRVVNSIESADVVLRFGRAVFSRGSSFYAWSDSSGNIYGGQRRRHAVKGEGQAIRIIPPNQLRIVWSFADTRKSKLEHRPSTNFARNFIKLIKKLRKE